ncbi:MAG: PE-PPE domain-containing protein [Mycolicibacterium insubricum]|nr:PE-PPE domain-containing protein [Mycobacterium sp.]
MALVVTAALAFAGMGLAALSWAAAQVLVVPGTGTQIPEKSKNYIDNSINYYVDPTGVCGASSTGCHGTGVDYPAQFWPIPLPGWGGLSGAKWNDSVGQGVASLATQYGISSTNPGGQIVIFGYSQGATVSSRYKTYLSTSPSTMPTATDLQFVLIGNPNRPNGGVFERLAILGTVPILDATFGQPTPTDTTPLEDGVREVNTTDIAFQYDGVADFPKYPINVLADLNALAGFWYVHGTYLDPRGGTETGPWQYGQDEIAGIVKGCTANNAGFGCQKMPASDTLYVTLPAKSLPLTQPFLQLADATGTGVVIKPLVAALQPTLQTLIETGYDRSDYSSPSPFGIVPLVNPITLARDLINDVPEGFNAARKTISTGNIPDLPSSKNPNAATVQPAAAEELNIQAASAVPPTGPVLATTPDPEVRRPDARKLLGLPQLPRGPIASPFARSQSRGTAVVRAEGTEETPGDGAAPSNRPQRPRPLRDLVRTITGADKAGGTDKSTGPAKNRPVRAKPAA